MRQSAVCAAAFNPLRPPLATAWHKGDNCQRAIGTHLHALQHGRPHGCPPSPSLLGLACEFNLCIIAVATATATKCQYQTVINKREMFSAACLFFFSLFFFFFFVSVWHGEWGMGQGID